eukprot:COSAG05_NODE_424_length_9929_cov_25.816378_6_plen_845_part_00
MSLRLRNKLERPDYSRDPSTSSRCRSFAQPHRWGDGSAALCAKMQASPARSATADQPPGPAAGPRKMKKAGRGTSLTPIGETELSPALGGSMLPSPGPSPGSGKHKTRRKSILDSGIGVPSSGPGDTGTEEEGSQTPMPECLQTDDGSIQLMIRTPTPRADTPQGRGKALWSNLRDTLRDPTTRTWLGLVHNDKTQAEQMHGNQEKRNRDQAAKAEDMGMFLPNSRFRTIWDFVQITLLSYISVMVPFRIGFDENAIPWEPLFVFDCFVDVYFVVDIYVNFNTCVVTKQGDLQIDRKEIAREYISTWFALDFVSCLPVHYATFLPGMEEGNSDLKANKVIRLLRLARMLKLLRLARINRLMQKYEEIVFKIKNSLKLLRIVFVMVIVGHWMCCLWYLIGSLELDPEDLDADGNMLEGWVWQFFDGPLRFENQTQIGARYLTSMYYSYATMTTVGYGDISATTTVEKIAAVGTMSIGGFVFDIIVGSLSDIAAKSNPGERMKNKQLSKVLNLLMGRNVKAVLASKIRNHFANVYRERTAIPCDEFIFALPEALQVELALALNYISRESTDGDNDGGVVGILHHVPFFHDLDTVSLIMICEKLKFWRTEKATPGEPEKYIMTEGSYSNEMYVVHFGSLIVETTHGDFERLEKVKKKKKQKERERLQLSEEESEKPEPVWPGTAKVQKLGYLGNGDFFGELAILLPHSPQGVRRRRTVYRDPEFSELYVELWCLSYDDVAELERMRPPIRRMLKPYKRQAIAARHRAPERPPRSSSGVSSSSTGTGASVNSSVVSADISAISSSRMSSYDVDTSMALSGEVAQLREQMNGMQGQLEAVIELLKQPDS